MFDDTWSDLERQARSAPGGEVRRRIRPESGANLWLVVYSADLTRVLRVGVGQAGGVDELPSGLGMEVRLGSVPGTGPVLDVILTNRTYEDVFDALIADVAMAASGPDAAILVAARVRRWQAFLREHLQGLSPARQRGLFGELQVLAWISAGTDPKSAVAGWAGPSGAPQDFAFGSVAVEVKTSAGKNPQSVRISSERQLDDEPVDRLYLWHLSVDERTGTGETLPACVARVRNLVQSEASVRFEDVLLEAGYHDAHADRYQIGRSLRSSDTFAVVEGFPRIVEADCPDGLGDVHYSLALGALADFKVGRDEVLDALRTVAGSV